jgi:hypothetical protein
LTQRELWVPSLQHARAAALLVEAQTEAEAAAAREAGTLATEGNATGLAARQAARGADRRAPTVRERKQARPRLSPHAHKAPEDDGRGVRVMIGLLVGFIVVLVLIAVVGERYGTRSPIPGRRDQTIHCTPGRYEVICR